MLKVYSIDGVTPVVHPSAFVHPTATLIGDVIVGPRCYIGPCASLRGDFGRILLEEGANVQDTCVMHGYPDADTVLEAGAHIGHGAVLHGCRVRRNALVGINAVVLDGAEIGEGSIVAAMAFIKEAFVVPPRRLVAGVPARVIRELSEDEVTWKSNGTALYQELAVRSQRTMVATEPLEAPEPDRKRVTARRVLPLHTLKKNRE